MVAFPLQDRYELLLAGEWVDVSDYVYNRDDITITRGRSAEADSSDPATMTLTLDNRTGRFSPRNPTSPYYGILGRNTQIRASLPDGEGGRLYRFYGEVAEWPATWRMGGHDAYVKITASGIGRRLAQNAPSIRSTMNREFSSPERQDIVAYWPLEDAAEATQIASGRSDAPPGRIQGSPELAGFTDWTATDPLPNMKTGQFRFTVPAYTATGAIRIRMFVFYPAGGASAETSLMEVQTTGSVARWELRLTPGGGLRTKAWDDEGVPIDDGPFVSFQIGALDAEFTDAFSGRGFCILDFSLEQVGSDLWWQTEVFDFANTDTIATQFPSFLFRGVLSNETVGNARSIVIGRDGGLGETKLGHLAVANAMDAYEETYESLAAWNGENPSDRMERLCTEEGIGFTRVNKGATGNLVALGDQLNRPLLDLLQEAADTDGGILFEPRDELGFAYRSRLSMHNQAATVTLDYSSGQVAGDLVPVDDDRSTVNDLTVKREAGSSVQMEETSGPLSTAEPPDGVGRYAGEVTLSLERDDQLPDQAGWRLHLGTVDEPRFPTLTVNLRAPGITADLAAQILALDVGDRIVLTGVPEGLPREDVSLLVQGYSESMRLMGHEIEFTLAPESPWHVGQVETDGYDRIDSSTSALAADATAGSTPLYPGDDVFPGEDVYPGEPGTLSVATTGGALWTTDEDDFPFDVLIAGERCTVTEITGTSSPQSFTVVRAVNGVVKALPSGAAVNVAESVYLAL